MFDWGRSSKFRGRTDAIDMRVSTASAHSTNGRSITSRLGRRTSPVHLRKMPPTRSSQDESIVESRKQRPEPFCGLKKRMRRSSPWRKSSRLSGFRRASRNS
ncbi:hypothetical protein RISK_003368 [Rhodopirellula islandica]|uniref:Uncharacterized protein n=1 Tax=Rhodopirellula islandica TaxID=595434 RepID=A0A0J1BDA6_RHOIS|nr:hypothetical protein RISK_003368 [Rhodopirellula islandica]